MGSFKDYVKDELCKMSREDLDKAKEELNDRVASRVDILKDCVLLNRNDLDSCTTWILAMMECILLLSKATSENDKENFDYLLTAFCNQIVKSKDQMLKEWDNG